jgi:hypothetical protein
MSTAPQLPNSGFILQTMELPTAQEKSEQIFFAKPKVHQFKFTETNKMVHMDPLWLIAFFEQCQTANKATIVLNMIKEKKQSKEKKTTHLPVAHSHDSSYQKHCCKNCNYHQSNQHVCNKQHHDSRHQDNQCHDHSCCEDKDYKKRSTRRRMIASVVTSRRRATRPCTTTSPFD